MTVLKRDHLVLLIYHEPRVGKGDNDREMMWTASDLTPVERRGRRSERWYSKCQYALCSCVVSTLGCSGDRRRLPRRVLVPWFAADDWGEQGGDVGGAATSRLQRDKKAFGELVGEVGERAVHKFLPERYVI